VGEGLGALIGTAPDTPLVYVLALLEVGLLASLAAVVLALVGLGLYAARSLPARAARRLGRLAPAAFATGQARAAPAAPAALAGPDSARPG
jgi:hypothetical protein